MTSGTSYSPPPAFGRFRLLHQIGAGVLGPVFRTHDPDHDRFVAVKAFSLDLTPEQSASLSAQFERLVELGIEHAYLAVPVAAGVEDFVPYLAVPYVAGESLDAAIRQYGPAPVADAVRLIAHVADALDAAALKGVFHGSLHPRDILVTPGETHVTGLGVSQALERLGLHGPIRRPYVAPERESGDEWGAAADIYSLAAIAYEVLTGRRALPGTDQPLAALSDVRVHDAAALKDVLEMALDPDPERRPSRARDFAAAFASASSETVGPLAAVERGGGHRPRKPRTRPSKLPGLDEPLLTAAGQAPSLITPAAPVSVVPPGAPAVLDPVALAPEPAVDAAVDASASPDIVQPEPVAKASSGTDLEPDIVFRLEPGTRHEPELPEGFGSVVDLTAAKSTTDASLAGEGLAINFDAFEADELLPAGSDGADVDSEGFEFSFPPAAPNLVAPSGFTPSVEDLKEEVAKARFVEQPPAPGKMTPANDLPEPRSLASTSRVPRAFEPGPPPPRPPAEVDERPRVPASWPSPVPILAGLAVGLVLGLAIGYALGSRPSVARSAPPAVSASAPRIPSARTQPPTEPPGRGSSTPAPVSAAPPAAGTEAAPAGVASPPPAVGESAATRAPGATRGDIVVKTTPASANVFVNGTRVGLAPRNLPNLRFGTYTIRVTRPGYSPQDRVVTLSADQASVVAEFELRPVSAPVRSTSSSGTAAPAKPAAPREAAPKAGSAPRSAPTPVVVAASLSVETRPPGARVRIDGREMGATPLTLTTLSPGTHAVELQLRGYRVWSSTVSIAAGQRRRITASLERDPIR